MIYLKKKDEITKGFKIEQHEVQTCFFHIPVYIFVGFTEQPPYHLLLIHWADALRNVKPLSSSVYCQPLMQPRDNRNPTLDQRVYLYFYLHAGCFFAAISIISVGF